MPTLDLRTSSLIEVSTLSSRPELRNELIAKFRIIKLSANITGVELYEVCLQTYLFAGFPAALESVRALSKVFDHQEYNNREQRSDVDGYATHALIGDILYKKVYADNAARVRDEMILLSPELAAWAMVDGYGKTLSREQLDIKTRELCIVAMLTQLGWDRQLYSHILGARNVGSTADEIREASTIGAMNDKSKLEVAEQLIKKLV